MNGDGVEDDDEMGEGEHPYGMEEDEDEDHIIESRGAPAQEEDPKAREERLRMEKELFKMQMMGGIGSDQKGQ